MRAESFLLRCDLVVKELYVSSKKSPINRKKILIFLKTDSAEHVLLLSETK